jgi:hypothetical protein
MEKIRFFMVELYGFFHFLSKAKEPRQNLSLGCAGQRPVSPPGNLQKFRRWITMRILCGFF